MKSMLHMALLVLIVGNCFGQNEKGVKVYPPGTKAGEITLLSSRFGSDGISSFKTFTIVAERTAAYELKAVTALLQNASLDILLDNKATGSVIKATDNGWQKLSAAKDGSMQQILIPAGKHEISFLTKGNMIPMVDDIFFQSYPGQTAFDNKWMQVKQMIDKAAAQPLQTTVADKSGNSESNIILPNPLGVYDHDLDASFAYTTLSGIYLTAGTTVTFATSGSTVDPVLLLFDPANIDNQSWANDDDGPGYESQLTVTIPVTSYYYLLVRPYFSGASGTTNITNNGAAYLNNTPLGGIRYNTVVRTGDLNYFTCRLTGGDTRIFTSNYATSAFNGYNDDYYSGNGDWQWGLSSRIKKNYTGNVGVTFVCAYSLITQGVCDVYMGNPNSDVNSVTHPEFPLLKADDAIMTSPWDAGNYNCTSWAGGVTSTWIWPPQWSSTYSCSGDATKLDCFDNFYKNYPVARYIGAWNYTRSLANSSNATIDLWKSGSSYTHASVRKPGNGNPHGYDWESKPGGTSRTLHPRNALNGNAYGAVTNHYMATGTYASFKGGNPAFNSDADAVKAGLAVVENAKLTAKAQDKLKRLTDAIGKNTTARFNELYVAWKKTWEANSIYSDPDMYCRNAEFDALAAFCNSNYSIIYLVFDKYINGDNFIGKIVWDNTRKQYSKLLDEAKTDFLNNPTDEQGRYKIHGDHDNGVHYIEKILNAIDESPFVATEFPDIKITVSPNPVQDVLKVQVGFTGKQKISIQLISMKTNRSVWMQPAKEFDAGEYRFTANLAALGSMNGDMIAVKLTAGQQEKVIKVIVMK